MKSSNPLTALVAIGVLTFTSQVAAIPLAAPGYSAFLSYQIDTNPPAPTQGTFVPAGPGAQASESTCLVSNGTRSSCGSSFATAGAQGNTASITDSNPGGFGGIDESSDASSWFEDIVTVSGLLPGSYTLVPTVQLDGTTSWNFPSPLAGEIEAGAAIFEFAQGGLSQAQNLNYNISTQGIFSVTTPLLGIAFQPGAPFNVGIGFAIAARIFDNDVAGTTTTQDFSSTLLVTGLEVLDSNGAPVDGWTIQAESGALFTPDGISAVPEPSALALFGAGLLGLAGIGSLRRKLQSFGQA